MDREVSKHKIRLDDYTVVELDIPIELDASEFKGLMMRVNKLFNISEAEFYVPTKIANKMGGVKAGAVRGPYKKHRIAENKNNLWTAEEDAKLKDLFLGGMTSKKVAEILNRTQNATMARLAILKITRKHLQPGTYSNKSQLQITSSVPKSQNKMAAIKQTATKNTISHTGKSHKGKVWTQNQIEEAKRMYLSGKTTTEIGKKMGRSTASVMQIFFKKGIKRGRGKINSVINYPVEKSSASPQLGWTQQMINFLKDHIDMDNVQLAKEMKKFNPDIEVRHIEYKKYFVKNNLVKK